MNSGSGEDEDMETAFLDALLVNLRAHAFDVGAADRLMAAVAEAARAAGGDLLIGLRAPGSDEVMIIDRFADLFET